MPNLEHLKKQAKLILRWHRRRYYPVAQRIRSVLPRYRQLSDANILARRFTLREAQDLIAREHGFENWQAFRSGPEIMSDQANRSKTKPNLSTAYPQIFVSDAGATFAFFAEKLGFTVAFTYGEPPFYGQVHRDQARLNIRGVEGPVFSGDIREREDLLAAYIAVEQVKELFAEYQAAGVEFHQTLKQQPWGAQDFIVRDADGNLLCFGSPTDMQD
jgi:uncharacterized glyoxalase superfamily protein PhnB